MTDTQPLFAKSLKENRQIKLVCPECGCNLRGGLEDSTEISGERDGSNWRVQIPLECVDDSCEVKWWWLVVRSPVIPRQARENDFTVMKIERRDDFDPIPGSDGD